MCAFFSEFWIFLFCARTFNVQTHVSDVLWYVFLVSNLCGFRAIFLVCGNVILISEGGRCIFFPIQSEEPDVCFRLLVAGALVDGFLLSIFLCPSSFFGILECQAEMLVCNITRGNIFLMLLICWIELCIYMQ